MNRLRKVFHMIEKICVELDVILLGVITLAIFYQVIARKLGFSVTWVDETTRYVFVLMVFTGTIHVAVTGSHIRITSFVDLLPNRVRKCTETLTYVLVAAISVLFAYSCFYTAAGSGEVRFSMLTFIRMSDLFYALGAAGVLIAAATVFYIVDIFAAGGHLQSGDEKEETT